jgi:hypothetical protein
MTTLDPAIYRRAAAIIRTDGLAKGHFKAHQGERVALGTIGALRAAAARGDLYYTSPEGQFLADLLGRNVVLWNDRPQTTADDVIALLERAAEKLEADA